MTNLATIHIWFACLEHKKIRTTIHLSEKTPHVRNFSARYSGAGNGCANLTGAWHFLVLSAGEAFMPIKWFALGRGGCWGFVWRGGGGSVNFVFMGAGIF